eukprot:878371-Prorocentrum_minimum.AAC.1
MDQSDSGSVGIFARWTHQTQITWVYSHDGKTNQNNRKLALAVESIAQRREAATVGIFSRRTNQTHETW